MRSHLRIHGFIARLPGSQTISLPATYYSVSCTLRELMASRLAVTASKSSGCHLTPLGVSWLRCKLVCAANSAPGEVTGEAEGEAQIILDVAGGVGQRISHEICLQQANAEALCEVEVETAPGLQREGTGCGFDSGAGGIGALEAMHAAEEPLSEELQAALFCGGGVAGPEGTLLCF